MALSFLPFFFFSLALSNNLEIKRRIDYTETLNLYNGIKIPRLGFGTAAINKESFHEIVTSAIENGFRLFDSAEATQWYDDRLLGESLDEVSVDRSDLFLVTKVFPTNYGKQKTRESVSMALENLKTSYVDLVLLHFPECWEGICGNQKPEGTWEDALKVLMQMLGEGKIRSLGVSNFNVPLLREASRIFKPHVVQNWMDPFHKDKKVVEYCRENDIVYMGYSTLGSQWQHRGYIGNPVFEDPTLSRIARNHKTNVADIVLKWGIQRGTIMIPRSNSIKNIAKNGKIFNLLGNRDKCEENFFWLSNEEMTQINNLPEL